MRLADQLLSLADLYSAKDPCGAKLIRRAARLLGTRCASCQENYALGYSNGYRKGREKGVNEWTEGLELEEQ